MVTKLRHSSRLSVPSAHPPPHFPLRRSAAVPPGAGEAGDERAAGFARRPGVDQCAGHTFTLALSA